MSEHDDQGLQASTSAAGLGRRRVVAGAAWTIPVLALATAAPLAAASPECPSIATPDGWTVVNSGPLRVNTNPEYNNRFGGALMPLPTNNANSYLSVQDRVVAQTATVTLSRTFTPVSGVTYTFTFDARVTANLTTRQLLQVFVGGTSLFYRTTQQAGGLPLLTPGVAGATYSFTWTAPNSSLTTFSYQFQIPQTSGDNDDIRVSLPTITSPSCR